MVKGKLAIVVPYMVDQNEPSRPHEKLVFVPDDPAKRDEFLLGMWGEFQDEDDNSSPEISVNSPDDYGDLQIGDGCTYLFFTFVNNDIRELVLN